MTRPKKPTSKLSEKGTFRTSPDFPDKITEPSTELSRSDLSEVAAGFARKSRAKSTLGAYKKHWRYFEKWCEQRELEALPASPETVAAYLTDRALRGPSVSTLEVAVSAIGFVHQAAGHEPPRHPHLSTVWEGIRRSLGDRPNRKAAITKDELREMVLSCGDTAVGIRDRVLLLVGFAGAFRRSELVTIRVEDIRIDAEGMTILVRRSKTDQEGKGALTGIRRSDDPVLCPVAATEAWLRLSKLEEGPLLRNVFASGRIHGRISPKTAVRRIKKCAERIGLDPKTIGGHSLRAGLATAAAKQGARTAEIMRQGRWKSSRTVDEVYLRPASVFENGAAKVL